MQVESSEGGVCRRCKRIRRLRVNCLFLSYVTSHSPKFLVFHFLIEGYAPIMNPMIIFVTTACLILWATGIDCVSPLNGSIDVFFSTIFSLSHVIPCIECHTSQIQRSRAPRFILMTPRSRAFPSQMVMVEEVTVDSHTVQLRITDIGQVNPYQPLHRLLSQM